MAVFLKWWKSLLYAGHVNEESAEIRKQIIISSLFSLLSFIVLLIFGLQNLGEGNEQLALVVMAAASVSGVNYLFLCRTGKYRISSIIIVVMTTALCLYLLCTGGNNGTGPLWMFILPGLIFYILGLYPGLLCISILLAITVYILFFPGNVLLQADYGPSFISRFIAAIFSVSVIAFVYEYSREDGRRELLNLSRKLDYLSRRDELTGLSNRRDMFEKLRSEMSRVERSGKTFSILLADVDRFKQVNDTLGHECGDYCLRQIASVLTGNTQKRDKVARWGGEEFLVLLPETMRDQAATVAERLRQALENQLIQYQHEQLSVTISIGVAAYDGDQSLNSLIHGADRKLYAAKRNGRNRVE